MIAQLMSTAAPIACARADFAKPARFDFCLFKGFFFFSFLTSIGDGAGIFHPKAKVRPDNVGGAMTKLFKRFDWEQETAWLEVPSPPLVRRLTSLGNGLGLLGS